MVKQREVPYGSNFKGTLFLPEGKGPHSCLILFHAWMGKDPFIKRQAEELSNTWGIATFAADLYGNGQVVHTAADASHLMSPLFFDRHELRKRVVLSFETAASQTGIKQTHVGAIGFCFGGLAAIELFRSGVPVAGVAAFHALLGNTQGGKRVKTAPLATRIKGRLLVLNGYLDPLVSEEDIKQFHEELSGANLNWQYTIYGKAKHAFTNPEAHDDASGLVFDQEICDRAFADMRTFFQNIL